MFYISEIRFPHRNISTENTIIIVGPNNSGKTTVINDIEKKVKNTNMKLLKEVSFSLTNERNEFENFKKNILEFEDGDRNNGQIPVYMRHMLSEDIFQHSINIDHLDESYDKNSVDFFTPYFKYYTCKLNSFNIGNLVKEKPFWIGNSSKTSLNIFTRYITQPDIQKELNKIIQPAIGLTVLFKKENQILKLYVTEYDNKRQSQSNNNETPILELGSGFICFIGICLTLIGYPFRIVLLDEPEIHLHPLLARTLGKYLVDISKQKKSQLVISTHSPDLLLGCLERESKITVVRLTYDGEKNNVSELGTENIIQIINTPLLRSTNLLSAFFHKYVIIVEGGVDRIFYSSINSKLLDICEDKGMSDVLFLDSIGKNRIHDLAKPLIKLNIPVISVYDFDILDNKEDNQYLFKTIMKTNLIDTKKMNYYYCIQQRLKNEIYNNRNHKEGHRLYRENGIESLSPTSLIYDQVSKMLNDLQYYGIFICPNGTIEQWLKNFNIKADGNDWLIQILQHINKLSSIPDLNGVWKFIHEMKLYCDKYKISNK